MNKICLSFVLAMSLAACTTTKEIAYFQDTERDEMMKIVEDNLPRIKPDDILSITVSSSKPELAAPYNLLRATQDVNSSSNRWEQEAYQVNSEGYINFPVLGALKVAGMTREELVVMLQKRLAEVMPDPVVTITFRNFKVIVLGEVARPGTFDVTSDRITVLEAVGKAGDLSVYGRRDNVLVIREVNGERKMARLNLKSKNIFESPYYYLQQNDVVYVEPNRAKAIQGSSFRSNFPLYLSSGSLLVTIATLIVTLTK